jgi:hypothetical protein
MRMSEAEFEAIQARRQTSLPQAIPCPPPVLTLRPRASVMAVGRTERGVMNKTEARYASEVLDVRKATGEIREYWYESIKLRLADASWFTVDFFVMLSNGILEAHECKGYWRIDAKVRNNGAAERYPFRFISAQKVKKKDGGGWKFQEF